MGIGISFVFYFLGNFDEISQKIKDPPGRIISCELNKDNKKVLDLFSDFIIISKH